MVCRLPYHKYFNHFSWPHSSRIIYKILKYSYQKLPAIQTEHSIGSHNPLSHTTPLYHKHHSNRIGGVMVSVLASSVVDRGLEPRSGQTKDYQIGICCFSAKHAALRRKSKDGLARNQNNVSEWSDMSTCGLLFQ